MARFKEFDPDTALQRAMELFWQRGYEGTSMAQLVEHLGISKASIYGTFGGKQDLHNRALRRYVETMDPPILDALSHPGPVLPAVRALIERYSREAADDQDYRGCMVVNTAVEFAGRENGAARLVEASWTQLENSLAAALTRARFQGELADSIDPRTVARFLLVFLQGVRVLARTPDPGDRLADATSIALAMLR